MKNIIEILKSQNIELTEEQTKAINDEVKVNYKTVADYDRQADKLELANDQLKKTKGAFEDFKKNYDGVDIEELKEKIDTLNDQLNSKETEYQTNLNRLDLTSKLKDKLREKGCLDMDLAITQFNLDDLLSSKNQESDLETALNKVIENKGMLFKEPEIQKIDTINVGGTVKKTDLDLHDQQLREAMGLPVKGD